MEIRIAGTVSPRRATTARICDDVGLRHVRRQRRSHRPPATVATARYGASAVWRARPSAPPRSTAKPASW